MEASIIVLIGGIIFFILAGVEHNKIRQREKFWTDELSEKASHLEGFKRRLDEYEHDLINREARLNMDAATPVRATYFTSESDLLKYPDDKKLIKAVKKALCVQLVDSMMKIVEPHKVRLEDGRDMYLIHYRVKEEL